MMEGETSINIDTHNLPMTDRLYNDIQAGSFAVLIVVAIVAIWLKQPVAQMITRLVAAQEKIADTLERIQVRLSVIEDDVEELKRERNG